MIGKIVGIIIIILAFIGLCFAFTYPTRIVKTEIIVAKVTDIRYSPIGYIPAYQVNFANGDFKIFRYGDDTVQQMIIGRTYNMTFEQNGVGQWWIKSAVEVPQ
jgi:hypothetical protein